MRVFTNTSGQTQIDYLKQEEQKSAPVIPIQDQMRIRKLYGGLPIYATNSDISPKVGEVFLRTGKRLCARFEGITVSVSLS